MRREFTIMTECQATACEALYREYGALVRGRARALLKDDDAAWDATHEVFLRAMRANEDFRGDASPGTWLYRITTNYCLNVLRSKRRRGEMLDAAHGSGRGEPAPLAAAPDVVLDARTALRRLPEPLRDVGVRYYVHDENQEEIATALGVARRTVSYRLAAFRTAARAVFAEELAPAV
jgi:RNA polymerase sigma-70 factor (ECF subfamily)